VETRRSCTVSASHFGKKITPYVLTQILSATSC
jgi:hypothetical protein